MTIQEPTSLTGDRNPAALYRAWRSERKNPASDNTLGYLFIAPALLLYLTFNIWPLIRGILMAFTDYRFVYPDTRWDWNGVENFVKLFGSEKVRESLWVSLKYTGIVVPSVLVIALLTAVLISQVQRGAGFYRWVVYLPTILPIAVSFLMFSQMYALNYGIINVVLRRISVEDPPHWLGEVGTALPAVGAAHTWIIFGFPTLLFLIGIYGIGADMYEAAALDGASRWQQFRYITLPQLKPTTAMVLILTIPGIFSVTDPMLILTQGGPQGSTQTLGYYLYDVAFQRGDLRLGYASAISLVVSLFTAAIVALIFLWSRERDA